MEMKTDVVIVGTGAAGLFSALNLSRDRKIVMITKADAESSDSFLAQGGICVLRNEEDYDSYFEDTMRAGHYENRKESVDIMIRSSQDIIHDLIGYGVEFQKEEEKEEDRENSDSGKRVRTTGIPCSGDMHLPGRERTPDQGSFFMKMLPEKRSQASFWRG